MRRRFAGEQVFGFLREAQAGMGVTLGPGNLSDCPGGVETAEEYTPLRGYSGERF